MTLPLMFTRNLKTHYLALLIASFVGLVYVSPQVFFVSSLGSEYRGIPMLQTPNEDSYLARIQDIVDGHGALGSPFLFEYKDQPPLSPPTGEWFYALPSIVLGISPATVLVISKFILPALLFLLVYLLIIKLTGNGGWQWQQKLNAIAGGLLVVLGYDLVDYRTVLSYMNGVASPSSFLLWARPVNPIFGALFLFSFLIFVLALMQHTSRRKSTIIGASVSLALMFSSYFFSWGIGLSVLVVLILLLLLRKEYKTAGTLALIASLGALLASPYWYSAWHAAQSPWYTASVLRSGLFLTHYPLLNKLLLVALLFFALTLAFDFFWKKKKGIAFRLEEWHWFCLALLLGGLWAYSQQIVTGRTIWPYHFVQYTIPLSIVVGTVVLYRIIREHGRYAWWVLVSITALSSLVFGVYTQISVYTLSRPTYVLLQDARPLFDWLNAQDNDCVVLQVGGNPEGFVDIIPAFTHCNLYDPEATFALMPEERIYHNYFVRLRLSGITGGTIDDYVREHESEVRSRLFTNWKGLYNVPQFPDFIDVKLSKRLKSFPEEYRAFLKRDFKTSLQNYRLDYILSKRPLPTSLLKELGNPPVAYHDNLFLVYAFHHIR